MSNDGIVGLKFGVVNLLENIYDMFIWIVVIKLWYYNLIYIYI